MHTDGPFWTLPERVGFRFFFSLASLYLAFVLLPNLLWTTPLPDALGQFWFDRVISGLWWPMAKWVKLELLHMPALPYVDAEPTAPMHVLVGLGCMVLLAAAITSVWSYFDRTRPQYRVLDEWLRVYIRYTVGALLLSYGFAKVFTQQFGPQSRLGDLVTPVGMLNPFWMLSSFMAASPAYQMFTGWVEVVTGLLLMIRRTSRVGALLAVPVMVNVVVLNFAYHFTMYVVSTGMLVMAVYLAYPELLRLIRLLVAERPVEAPARVPLFRNSNVERLSGVLAVIVLLSVGANLVLDKRKAAHQARATPPLFGVYEVQEMRRNGVVIAPLLTDESVWRRFTVDRGGGSLVFTRDTIRFGVRTDTANGKLSLVLRQNPKNPVELSFWVPDPDHLVLVGIDGLRQAGATGVSDSVRIMMRKLDVNALPLLRPAPWFR